MAISVLAIGATTTTTRAFKPVDLTPLQAMVRRGENVLLPHAAGRRPYALVLDELEVTLEWRLNGFFTIAGAVAANYVNELETSQEFYRALFCDGADGNGEKAVTLTTAIDTLTGNIQVVTWDPIQTGPGTRTILTRLRVAAGAWT